MKPIRSSGRKFYFEGVIKNIYLLVANSEASIFFDCLDSTLSEYDNFDHRDIEYIGVEAYDSNKGFYDADRTDGVFDYFETREELYINNVFEKIVEYCNKHLV